jgi:hypothetical protein
MHQEKKGQQNSTKDGDDQVLPPSILTRGVYSRSLDAPSHVVLNHVNCMREVKTATQLPQVKLPQEGVSDSTATSQKSEDMSMVAITQRLSKNKFITCMYYKPKAIDK